MAFREFNALTAALKDHVAPFANVRVSDEVGGVAGEAGLTLTVGTRTLSFSTKGDVMTHVFVRENGSWRRTFMLTPNPSPPDPDPRFTQIVKEVTAIVTQWHRGERLPDGP